MNLHSTLNRLRMLALGVTVNLVLAPGLMAGSVIEANPGNYRSLIANLQAGDTLQLAAGTYDTGLPVSNLHGTSIDPIIISGPEDGEPAVFVGRSCCNTVQIGSASHVVIRHLKLDGLGIPYVDAVNSRSVTHHITIENLLIVNHGGDYQPDTSHQGTVGIATRAPAWDWVIRNNVIIGAGTGMYLGNSNGAEPFVRGLIEHNVIMDTLGYNIEIKHQAPRPTDVGLPTEDSKTIIRHNVFSKANNASRSGAWARPNLLVGHWPLSGLGSNDLYEIYGNFFYENPSEVLFQGEGNIALYDNVFVNSSGSAVSIQAHNDRPRTIRVFNNTVAASGTGIRVAGVNTLYDQLVAGNAVFAATPIAGNSAVVRRDNITDAYSLSVNYLGSPTGSLGLLDLYPVSGMLSGAAIDTAVLQQFTDWDRDFNGQQRDGTFRGAYAGEGQNPGWLLALDIKPEAADINTGNDGPTDNTGGDSGQEQINDTIQSIKDIGAGTFDTILLIGLLIALAFKLPRKKARGMAH